MTTSNLVPSSSSISPIPPALRQALIEFQLMPAFRARPVHQRDLLVSWVADSEPPAQRDRIAEVLDDLAGFSKVGGDSL